MEKDDIKLIDSPLLPDLLVLCYDIETTTHNISKFPNPYLYSNKIV